MKIVTTSIELPAVVSVGAPPANLTAVESVSAKVAVLDPVPSCVIIIVTLCPVARLSILKSQLPVSVILCIVQDCNQHWCLRHMSMC